jgi:(1->4)-alpha-D-glucan 1-alpha-D-glucosylmutase
MALLEGGLPLVEPARWDDTAVVLPKGGPAAGLHDWLSDTTRGATLDATHNAAHPDQPSVLYLREALNALPVAVLSNLAPA